MQAITADILATNAYRCLGLGIGANQAAIDGAARRMRLWPDPRRIAPTPFDALWLGKLSRSQQDVNQAVVTLREPLTRLQQRVLWYWDRPPASMSDASAIAATPLSVANRHDAFVLSLHTAAASDPDITDPPRWEAVIGQLGDLTASSDWVQWLTELEQQGAFDKRASAQEVQAAAGALPQMLAAALISRAHSAIEAGEVERCNGILLLVERLGEQAPAGAPGRSDRLRGLLDQLEDNLVVHCRELEHELGQSLRTNVQAPWHFYSENLKLAENGSAFFDQKIDPVLRHLRLLAPEDPDRLMRARSRAAQALALVALGWEWSGRFIRAEQTYLAALELARGTPVEMTVIGELQRCSPLADQQREQEFQAARHQNMFQYSDVQYATSLSQAGVAPAAAPATVQSGDAKEKEEEPDPWMESIIQSKPRRQEPAYSATTSSGNRYSVFAILFIVMVFLRIVGILSRSDDPSTSTRPPSRYLESFERRLDPAALGLPGREGRTAAGGLDPFDRLLDAPVAPSLETDDHFIGDVNHEP